MRPKYQTRAIVLARRSFGEGSLRLSLATEDVGLITARAQNVRKPGAKLASALTTLSESSVHLVRGTEGWRIAGAVSERSWFSELPQATRTRAIRTIALLLRLAPVESSDKRMYSIITDYLAALVGAPERLAEGAEILAALKILTALGLDAGEIPADFSQKSLESISAKRSLYVSRINRGIEASGL